MIRKGIKNYFVNLKHFFTPIGTLAVGMFLGLSVLIPGSLAIISALIERLSEIVNDATIDFTPLKDSLVDAVRSLDWSDPVATLKIVLSRDWIVGVINECINAVAEGLQPFADAISDAVNQAISGIVLLFILFVILCIFGLISGYFLTRFLVRRTMAKRTFKKFLFAVFVDSFITTLLISGCFWLVTVWAPSIFITPLFSLVIFGCSSLISAYNVHGRKKIKLTTVINIHNVFNLLFLNFMVFIISFALLFVTIAVTNIIAGILIGFSFVEIAFLVMSMNAESYVIGLVAESGAEVSDVAKPEIIEIAQIPAAEGQTVDASVQDDTVKEIRADVRENNSPVAQSAELISAEAVTAEIAASETVTTDKISADEPKEG